LIVFLVIYTNDEWSIKYQIIFHVTINRPFPSTDGKTRKLGMFKNREGINLHNVDKKTEIRNWDDMVHTYVSHY